MIDSSTRTNAIRFSWLLMLVLLLSHCEGEVARADGRCEAERAQRDECWLILTVSCLSSAEAQGISNPSSYCSPLGLGLPYFGFCSSLNISDECRYTSVSSESD